MRSGFVCLTPLLAALLVCQGCDRNTPKTGLRVTYGVNGLERLSFNDVVLENLARYPADAFHIWHIKTTPLHGQSLSDRQYGWGEVNNGRKWDAASRTWHYSFIWGSVSLQFERQGNTLAMHVLETNNPDSGITLEGCTIYPFVLHFPQLPDGFGESSYEHLAVHASEPAPTADFGAGTVSIEVPGSDAKPLYRGFEPAGAGGPNFFPVISSTALDSMAPAYPKVSRPVAPGASDRFTVALRFTGSAGE